MKTLFIFGDSIPYGYSDDKGGWANKLKVHFDKTCSEENEIRTYNLGIPGDETEDLLNRLEFETQVRLNEDKESLFLFAIGINDSQFLKSKNEFRVPKDRFEKNIEKLIKSVRKYSNKIIFLGLTPVNESKTTPVPWDKDKSYKNEFVKKYDETIKAICKKNKISFIEIYDELIVDSKKWADGLHPESKSHKKIFEIVKKELKKQKII